MNKEIKNKLDALYYEVQDNWSDFIKNDPIQFCHNYVCKENIEIVGVMAAFFSYGSRKQFIPKIKCLLDFMGANPIRFIKQGRHRIWQYNHKKIYRFHSYHNLFQLFSSLEGIYKEYDSLEKACIHKSEVFKVSNNYSFVLGTLLNESFGCPNGVNKRLNMFLRWMVRNDNIDLGEWTKFDKKDLVIPLDVHVGRISREIWTGLPKTNNTKAVYMITQALKKLDADDPIKYDLALFSLGTITQNTMSKENSLEAVEDLRNAVAWFNYHDEHFNERFQSAEDMIKFYKFWKSHSDYPEFADRIFDYFTIEEQNKAEKEVLKLLKYQVL